MKMWYASRTVWGLVGAGLASLLMLIGFPEAVANDMAEEILTHLIPIIGIASSIWGYFGRKRAGEPIIGPIDGATK